MENQLILRCKQGDSSAFGELIKGYKKQLFTYLVRLSGNSTMAEDLFQETLIKVWNGLPSYKEQNKFSSWLFSIAHNIAIDAHRKNRNNERVDYADDYQNEVDNKSYVNDIENKELKDLIIDSLKHLPEKQRNVFLLRQHSGMTYKEIADTTGENLNTVLSHMNYAVKKIRKKLRDKNVIG